MDKNQIIGFLLIGAILLGFFFLTNKNAEKNKQQETEQVVTDTQNTNNIIVDTNNVIENDTNIVFSDTTLSDSALIKQELYTKFGDFASAAQGEEEFVTLKNDLIELKINTKGGRIYSANVLKYKTYSQEDLLLFDGDLNKFEFHFFSNAKLIKTSDLFFISDDNSLIYDATQTENAVSLKAKINENQYIEYIYKLKPNSYVVDFDINFVNLENIIQNNTTFIELYWEEYLRHLERGEKWETENTLFFYKLHNSTVEKLNARKDVLDEQITSKVSWIGYKQQFFSSVLISKNYFADAKITNKDVSATDSVHLKYMSSKLTIPFQNSENYNIPLAFYFGPNKYSILRKVEINEQKAELDKMIYLGKNVIGFVNKFVIIPLFNILEKFIGNFGLIILIMTVIIKLVLFPLTYRSYASSAKMRILKPEVDKVTEKFGKDKQMERQQATMDLYKKAGVNPLGGCLPILLQFPFLVALFRFFPASIELRQESFLWVSDLSTYDAIVSWTANIPIVKWIFGNHISLFTLLMAITMVINTMLTNTNMDTSNPQAKSMKFMMYLMPVMMIVWFNNYSAGLSYYYFLSTLIGIFQILIIRKFTDEAKVLAKLRENIQKNKETKKSNFQKRLEDMQRNQNIQKNNRKK